jgi:tetratricopeptide (TPR) repeat protein
MSEDPQKNLPKEEPLDPDSEVWTAKQSIILQELEHAVFHIGRALSADPSHDQALKMLDDLIGDAKQPLKLAPLIEGVPYTTAACHSYILAKTERIPEAVNLLLQVLQVRPDTHYYSWLKTWSLSKNDSKKSINPSDLHAFLATWIEHYPKFSSNDEWHQLMIDTLPKALPALMNEWLEKRPPSCLILGASVLRRLEAIDIAMSWASQAHQRAPSWQTAVGKAMIHAQRNEVEEAVASYHEALSMDPVDLSVRLDLGDLLSKHERYGEGLDWYDLVLKKDPEHPWAIPSRLYVLWLQNGKTDYGEALGSYAQKNPGNVRANLLSSHFEKQQSAFVKWLPEPTDSIIDVVRQATSKASSGRLLSLTSSSLESPSAHYASNWQLGLSDLHPLPEVTVTKIQSPDPREPLKDAEFQLWTYKGMTPSTKLPKPSKKLSPIVSKLARESYHLEAWWNYAHYEAQNLLELFDKQELKKELLSVMVHPPKLPQNLSPWIWMQKVQIAAALILAQLEIRDQESILESKLASILRGPADWSVNAAILALAQVARHHPKTLNDIAKLFSERLQSIPEDGPVCYTYTLVCNTLRLPGLSRKTQVQLQAWKREFYDPVL